MVQQPLLLESNDTHNYQLSFERTTRVAMFCNKSTCWNRWGLDLQRTAITTIPKTPTENVLFTLAVWKWPNADISSVFKRKSTKQKRLFADRLPDDWTTAQDSPSNFTSRGTTRSRSHVVSDECNWHSPQGEAKHFWYIRWARKMTASLQLRAVSSHPP